MKIISKTGFGLIAVAALASACASTQVPRQLADARVAYSRAAKSPNAALVPQDMLIAKDSIVQAEKSYADHGDNDKTRNLAYVAQRRAISADAKGGAVRATMDKQVAVAEYQQLQQQHAQAVAGELQRSRQQLGEIQQRAESERQARIQADQRAQEALSKIQDLKMERQQRGLVLTISGNVLFATGKSALLPPAQQRLRDVAAALKDDPRPVLIVGHTDSTGSHALNERLSEQRADSVKRFLVQNGVSAQKVSTGGAADTQPITSNATPEGRANNRRVEIILEERPGQQGGQGVNQPGFQGGGVQGGTERMHIHEETQIRQQGGTQTNQGQMHQGQTNQGTKPIQK